MEELNIIGIDLAKRSSASRCSVGRFGPVPQEGEPSTFSARSRDAWWRWRPVRALIIGAERLCGSATM